MKMRTKFLIAAGFGLAMAASGAAFAMQSAEQLRASGAVGEQADGYLGVVGSASADVRARVDAINIERRAGYTDIAARNSKPIEAAAATVACQILATRISPGQYYRLSDGVWRKRNGNEPVPLPDHCG